MAWVQRKGDGWYCEFRYHGQRHYFTIGEVSEMEARATVAKVDYLLMRLKQHLMDLSAGCDSVTFLKYDGKPPAVPPEPVAPPTTLGKLRDEYFQQHSHVLDRRTIADMRGHWKHLARLLREDTSADVLTLAALQTYVMSRVTEGVEPATAKKETVTLRTCWNWGLRMDLVKGPFPNRGLRFPKGKEKPQFMTLAEVERRIAAGESDELWESVFLTRPEIDKLLAVVEKKAAYPWVYPLFCFVAHTGARRGEMLRLLVTDVDLAAESPSANRRSQRRSMCPEQIGGIGIRAEESRTERGAEQRQEPVSRGNQFAPSLRSRSHDCPATVTVRASPSRSLSRPRPEDARQHACPPSGP
jgi:integrase